MQYITAVGLMLVGFSSALYIKNSHDIGGISNLSGTVTDTKPAALISQANAGLTGPIAGLNAPLLGADGQNKKKNKKAVNAQADASVPAPDTTDLSSIPGSIQDKITSAGTLMAGNMASMPVVGDMMNTASGLPGAETLSNLGSGFHDTLSNIPEALGNIKQMASQTLSGISTDNVGADVGTSLG